VPPADRTARPLSSHDLTATRFAFRRSGRSRQLIADGWFEDATRVDPTATGVSLELSGPDGRVLYRAEVPGDRFLQNPSRLAFRFVAPRDGSAPAGTNGLTQLVVRRNGPRTRVAAVAASDALARAVGEPAVRWTLRFGETCVRDLALECAPDQGAVVRCE
jgi:hypothetical protein